MAVIGIYTKDFPDLGRAVLSTDIVPITENGNVVTYKTTISELLNSKITGTAGQLSKFGAANTLTNSILSEIGSAIHLTNGASSFAAFGIINPGTPGDPGVDNDAYIGSTINNDFLIRVNNTEALRVDTALRLKIANIPNADTDTDKFLVSDNGTVKYRTGAQVLSDIGGASSSSLSNYVTLNTIQSITQSKTFTQSIFFNNGVVLEKVGTLNKATTFANTSLTILNLSLSNSFGFNNNNNIYFSKVAGFGAELSFNNSANRIYTLQNNNGTLAFLSDIPSLANYVTLDTAQTITAAKTFSTSGGSDTLIINHSSGSGIALNITKGGNGEGIYVNKTSGTGNAVTIVGTLNATTLVKNGGTSSQFLKADGSIDSNFYALVSSLNNYLPTQGGTLTGALFGTTASFSGNITSGSTSVGAQINVFASSYGNNGLFNAYGTDGNIKLQMGGGSNTNAFIYTGAGNSLSLWAGANERLTITSGGNVGIGTTSPQTILQLGEGSLSNNTTNQYLRVNSGGYNALSYAHIDLFNFGNNFGNPLGWRLTSGTESVGVSVGRFLSFNTVVTDGSGNPSTATERMRITSGGDVLVGITSTFTNARYQSTNITGSKAAMALKAQATTESTIMEFWNPNGQVGDIRTNGSSTSYVTTSDYRLKQDFKDFNGLSLIFKIKTYDYQWKSDSTRSFGVLAHELQEIIPYSVTGKKDGEQMQGVDYSKLVPVLVKAIQELSEKVKQLENK
jgi:hypothetical protein